MRKNRFHVHCVYDLEFWWGWRVIMDRKKPAWVRDIFYIAPAGGILFCKIGIMDTDGIMLYYLAMLVLWSLAVSGFDLYHKFRLGWYLLSSIQAMILKTELHTWGSCWAVRSIYKNPVSFHHFEMCSYQFLSLSSW